jgi:putative oxidoreductase
MQQLITKWESGPIAFLRTHAKSILRVALGIVFLWFGLLKIIGQSPVADLISHTYTFLPLTPFMMFLGIWEVVIGLGLITNKFMKVILPLMWLQMFGTFFSVVLTPSIFFMHGNPLLLTTEGEFVIKNLVLVAASFPLL